MPNNYFQFKQFIVQQDKCAMKVTTDGCLFGAWVSSIIQYSTFSIQHSLDIGTGTGLLSLMVAQQNNVSIDAVEIDEQAAQQAKDNINASKWKDQITVHHTSIQQYKPEHLYNFIYTNPPFFDNDLKSANTKRNLALHSTSLSLEELLNNIQRLLISTGNFAILLPYHRTAYFEELATLNGFYLQEKVLVKQTPAHDYFRSMLLFGKASVVTEVKEIIIQQKDKTYSADFIELLKAYYLYL